MEMALSNQWCSDCVVLYLRLAIGNSRNGRHPNGSQRLAVETIAGGSKGPGSEHFHRSQEKGSTVLNSAFSGGKTL